MVLVKANLDLRMKIKESRLKHWMIAQKLQMTETSFSRKLRHELSIPDKYLVYKAIEELLQESQRKK